ncbi:TPA: Fic family protein [Candidatus Micrarchaeota archaeon]|nr:Fic family protein [Candidatus Micrarchaeota archaeon]
MRTRKKIVGGLEYYYLEETLRLEKPKVYSLFLGKRIPARGQMDKKKDELLRKIYSDLLGSSMRIYLTGEELIGIEKQRRRYFQKMKRLGKAAQDEKDEIDTVNFVYTTLTTEGVPITKADADLAYKFTGKNIRNVRDENLQVALDMIKGLRYVKESKKGISLNFLLELHKLIMAGYKGKNPGKFRKKQAYIFLKSYEKVEEIRFRPPTSREIENKISKLVEWYNLNVGKLNAVELAAQFHLRFYMIHPFEDGNKRVSRLLLNKAFFDTGYPMLNISKDTQGYFDALIRSVEKKNEQPFVRFVFGQFIKQI